ncbi:MAG: aldehyde dehydrogenase family protein [Aquabacterium sp.]
MSERILHIDGIALMPDHRIGGRWVDGPGQFDAVSPIDGRYLGGITLGTPEDAVEALQAAAMAFPAWALAGAAGRATALHWLADEIDARSAALTMLECLDTGQRLDDLRGPQGLAAGTALLRQAADAAVALEARPLVLEPEGCTVHHRPAGVCVVLLPAMMPLRTALWRLAGALAAGNTVVLKPSELAPLSLAGLADVVCAAEAAGMPAGVINIVHGPGYTVGAQMLADPRVARVAFTGSAATARWVAQVAGSARVPVSLEAGGRGACVVLPGADLAAVEDIAVRLLRAGTHDCAAVTRLVLPAALAEPLADRLAARLPALVVGDPRLPGTGIGPLPNDIVRARVMSMIDKAVLDGAQLRSGGQRHDAGELYMQPTLLWGVKAGSLAAQYPLEAPVLSLQVVADEDEAVALANGVEGVVSAVCLGPADAARRVAARLRGGQVWVNGWGPRAGRAPWGGVGAAGVGRTGGAWGFDFQADVSVVYGGGEMAV